MVADSFNSHRARFSILAGVALVVSAITAPVSAQRLRPADELDELSGVGVVEKLGDTLPLDLTFTNAEGELQPLSRYINGSRPTILVMVYFDCPMICPVVLDKLAKSLNDLEYIAGRDFNLMVVSFDPTDTTTHAFDRKLFYLSGYNYGQSPEVATGFQFMTGEPNQIRKLTGALGLDIKLLSNGEYSHPVALSVISPDGMIARYIYGLDYDPKQIKLSLLEASNGKIAKSLGDQFMFRCFRYNYTEGKYSMSAMVLMRIGGIFTVVTLILLIGGFFIKERFRSRSNPDRGTRSTLKNTGSRENSRSATTGSSL